MMNKKVWFTIFLVMPLYGDLSIGQMETMVEKIKAKRIGTSLEKSTEFVSPFVMIQKEKGQEIMEDPKSTEMVFTLGAIINKKAFVNQKWLEIGDTIEGYRLTEINDDSVTLVQEDRTIQVFLRKSKPILQLNEG